MFHRGESEVSASPPPRYRVTCAGCGHSEDLGGTTRSGNCRRCGHDAVTVEPIGTPPPPEPPPSP